MISKMLFPVGSTPDGPPLETRKALLLIDLQNDFLDPKGKLYTPTAQNFLPKVPLLVEKFREKGDIIWVRTVFQQPRPTISPDTGNYNIILQQFLSPHVTPKPQLSSTGSIEIDEDVEDWDEPQLFKTKVKDDVEAFLDPRSGGNPKDQCCLNGSFGSDVPQMLADAIKRPEDLELVKSHYSAFVDSPLLLHLRTRMITEVYVCGSLSNTSVYASVLDAVRHGIGVTLIEDCLGYQHESCHIEAVRQMADAMGAEGIDYQELMDDLAGLLGEVIREEDFQQTFQISVHPRAQSGPLHSRYEYIRSVESNFEIASNKSASDTSDPDRNKANRPENITSKSHESLSNGDSATKSYKRSTPEVSPPRKRSTSDLDEQEEERLTKLSHKPSARRASQETQPADRSRYQLSKARIRRQNPPQEKLTKQSKPSPATRQDLSQMSERKCPDEGKSPSSDTVGSLAVQSNQHLASESATKKKNKNLSKTVGLNEEIGMGDCQLVRDVLSCEEADATFTRLKTAISWQKMFHRSGEVPRLVAVQGVVDASGNIVPIYRHPADESPVLLPFDTTVELLRKAAENVVGHPLNHVLIQWYRNGEDNISEHSDKTLDIVKGSSIVNFSLGAQRTMTLRTKKSSTTNDEIENGRSSQRVPLPHNSMFVLGLATNQNWLHSIRADKRPVSIKSPAETAFDGERISLTFRHIGTFIDLEKKQIWGQGARSKTQNEAHEILDGSKSEAEGELMIRAFGQENHRSVDWKWDEWYGTGFDVVNVVTKEV